MEKGIALRRAARSAGARLAGPASAQLTDELYRPDNVIGQALEDGERHRGPAAHRRIPADEIQISAEEASQRPVVRLVDLILSRASSPGQRHPHRAGGRGFAVAYRIDACRQVMKVPRRRGSRSSRGSDHLEPRHRDRCAPQDGRARVAGERRAGGPALPPSARWARKVVIRILDSRPRLFPGLLGLKRRRAERDCELSRSTRASSWSPARGERQDHDPSSAIRAIRRAKTNIVTVEDPVEYRLQGSSGAGARESRADLRQRLRSILRPDPDVVLVARSATGKREHRDPGVLTGHLVLSTLHTNDAANAVTRLVGHR